MYLLTYSAQRPEVGLGLLLLLILSHRERHSFLFCVISFLRAHAGQRLLYLSSCVWGRYWLSVWRLPPCKYFWPSRSSPSLSRWPSQRKLYFTYDIRLSHLFFHFSITAYRFQLPSSSFLGRTIFWGIFRSAIRSLFFSYVLLSSLVTIVQVFLSFGCDAIMYSRFSCIALLRRIKSKIHKLS